MWASSNFICRKNNAQKFRGEIGVVVPSLEELKQRFGFIDRPMQGSEFFLRGMRGPFHGHMPLGKFIESI